MRSLAVFFFFVPLSFCLLQCSIGDSVAGGMLIGAWVRSDWSPPFAYDKLVFHTNNSCDCFYYTNSTQATSLNWAVYDGGGTVTLSIPGSNSTLYFLSGAAVSNASFTFHYGGSLYSFSRQ